MYRPTKQIINQWMPEFIQRIAIFEFWLIKILSAGLVELIQLCPFKGCMKELDRHSVANHIRHSHQFKATK